MLTYATINQYIINVKYFHETRFSAASAATCGFPAGFPPLLSFILVCSNSVLRLSASCGK